jgi:phosphoribosyl-AMP cyclohydrolase
MRKNSLNINIFTLVCFIIEGSFIKLFKEISGVQGSLCGGMEEKMSKEYTNELLIDFGEGGQELLPVVTQDSATMEVLIFAFANKEAFDETRRSGYATYWSRSRNELWKKGLTSGDMLKVDEIRINCEQNSLLYLVTPQGKGACHAKNENGMPYSTCYYRKIQEDNSLEIIK